MLTQLLVSFNQLNKSLFRQNADLDPKKKLWDYAFFLRMIVGRNTRSFLPTLNVE